MPVEKILILTSSPELGLDLEQRILQPAGYNITFVTDYHVALDLLKRSAYHLAVLGGKIGTMSGLEGAANIAEGHPALPLILVGQDVDALAALRNGIWDVLPWPAEPSQVLEVVGKALARAKRLRDWGSLEARKANRKLQRNVEILESLHRVACAVTSYLELDSILTTVVDAAVDMTAAEEGSLLLLDESTGELYMRAARNFQDDFVRKFRLPIRDSLAGQVLRTGKPLMINADTPQKIKTSYLVHTLLYVPLIVHNRVIGVLGVDNRQSGQPFQEEYLNLISTLADYAAIAIENARLYTLSDIERKKLETVLTKVEDGVIVVDHENRLVLANHTARSAFNIDSGNLVGKKVADVLTHIELLEIFEDSRPHPSRTEINLEDGRVFNTQVTPISEVGTVVTMQDITYLKELDRIKGDFVNTVSHDLRSPLTAILGYVELIERAGPVTEQQKDFIRRIQVSVNSITTLINDLLDLGRIEAGFDARKELISLPAIINYIVEDLHLSLEKKQQSLAVEADAHLPTVLGNPLRMRQMITNLVTNALKFSPPGQTVILRVRAEGDQLIIQVQDHGPGIPPTDQPYIFNKFYRASNVIQDVPGIGLGLAIVKSIVENHGGRIWVESILGEGSTFTIVLPIAQV